MLQWLVFGGLALVWMTFCGANLLMLFSDRNSSFIPLIGAISGALAGLVMPELVETSSRLVLAVVLFVADPYWLAAPLHTTRAWLQRR